MRRRHESMKLSAGEVALIADFVRGMSDHELADLHEGIMQCLPVFVPLSDRGAAVENLRRLGLLPE